MDSRDRQRLERGIAKEKANLLRQIAADIQAGRIKPDNMVQHLKVIADRVEGDKKMETVYLARVAYDGEFPEENDAFIAGVFSNPQAAELAAKTLAGSLNENSYHDALKPFVTKFVIDTPKEINALFMGNEYE